MKRGLKKQICRNILSLLVRHCLPIIYILSLVTAFTTNSEAQIIDTIHYDQNWLITTPDEGFYYKVTSVDTLEMRFYGRFTDYTKNGQIMVSGGLSLDGLKHGNFEFYYANGNLKKSGSFFKDRMAGKWTYYYSNGQIRDVIYLLEKDFLVKEAYDPTGKKIVDNGNGHWIKWQILESNNDVKIYGNLDQGKKKGRWTVANIRGSVRFTETYSNGVFQKGKEHDYSGKYPYSKPKLSNNIFGKEVIRDKMGILAKMEGILDEYPYVKIAPSETTGHNTNESFEKVEERPEYPGGMAKFYKNVYRSIKYLYKKTNAYKSGRVFVEFVVEKDGSPSNIKVIEGINEVLDKEAIRAVKEAGNWNPGRIRGKPVKVRMILPIKFK